MTYLPKNAGSEEETADQTEDTDVSLANALPETRYVSWCVFSLPKIRVRIPQWFFMVDKLSQSDKVSEGFF